MDEDAARLARQNFKNSRTALLITAGVAGICKCPVCVSCLLLTASFSDFYSMYAVKQENILEELDNAVQQK